jgi:hypothetical protein
MVGRSVAVPFLPSRGRLWAVVLAVVSGQWSAIGGKEAIGRYAVGNSIWLSSLLTADCCFFSSPNTICKNRNSVA